MLIKPVKVDVPLAEAAQRKKSYFLNNQGTINHKLNKMFHLNVISMQGICDFL